MAESVERLPASRVISREEDTRPSRSLPSDLVHIPAEVRIKRLRPVRLGPNAPLLIRLVRQPYALRTVRPVRRAEASRERPSTLDREPFPDPAAELAALRESYRVGRPMRQLEHRPDPRPRPFERLREREPVEPVFFDPRAEEGWL